MRSLFDTSVLVNALVDQLDSHESALHTFLQYSKGDNRGFCSTHTLAECYATLTALPLVTRILPEHALFLVEEEIVKRLDVIELTREDYVHATRQVAHLGLVSGNIYDALHARCAQKAEAVQIFTYNLAHFRRLQLEGIRVTAP